MSDKTTSSTPWHLWVVGIVCTLWSSIGAFDYTMSQMRNEAYLSGFSPEQIAYFEGFPTWAIAVWAIGVWGGVLGCLLILMKKKLATSVLSASFGASFVLTIYNYGFYDGFVAAGDTFSIVFAIVIVVVAYALLWYANIQLKRGVLS